MTVVQKYCIAPRTRCRNDELKATELSLIAERNKMPVDIDGLIEAKMGEVRTDAFDISFGELINLYDNAEFTITPDFQRLFRWEIGQRSRFVESVILELPIPQIIMIENTDGVLELIDGLQRISSMVQFIDSTLLEDPNKSPLTLAGCDLVDGLNGLTFDDLPVAWRLRVKRAKVRAVVIKRQSSSKLRYAMFKRLNTGGAVLSQQEIRNCTSRMVGAEGVKFYDFLIECAKNTSFASCIASLPEEDAKQRGDEELVLRFLAMKNAAHKFKGSVVEWLNGFMEDVIMGHFAFNYREQRSDFDRLFGYLDSILADGAFVRYRDGRALGGLAPAYFEAVSFGTWRALDTVEYADPELIRAEIIKTVQTPQFRSVVGSGSNSLTKFNGRIGLIENALREVAA